MELFRTQRDTQEVIELNELFALYLSNYCKQVGSEISSVPGEYQRAFNLFKARVETGKIKQPLRASVWELFLEVYHESKNVVMIPYVEKASRFIPRFILTTQLKDGYEVARRAIEKTFRTPAKIHHEKGSYQRCSIFDAVYATALEVLFKKPPEIDEKNPALLYTYFCVSLNGKAYDECKKNEKSRLDLPGNDFSFDGENVGFECHKSTETVDYVMEEYNLAELAGTEDVPSAVLWLLAKLDEGCNQLLTSFYIKGWSYEVIAERFNINKSSVGKTKERCLDKLTNLLKDIKNNSNG